MAAVDQLQQAQAAVQGGQRGEAADAAVAHVKRQCVQRTQCLQLQAGGKADAVAAAAGAHRAE
jgi:hypothetical protein